MPMDIRSFFKAKGGPKNNSSSSSNKKKKKEESNNTSKSSVSSSSSSVSRRKVGPNESKNKDEAAQRGSVAVVPKKKNRLVIDDEDSDEEEEEKPVVKQQKPSPKQVIDIDDEDDDDDEEANTAQVSSSKPSSAKKRKTTQTSTATDEKPKDDGRVAISTEEFFSKSAADSSSSSKKKLKPSPLAKEQRNDSGKKHRGQAVSKQPEKKEEEESPRAPPPKESTTKSLKRDSPESQNGPSPTQRKRTKASKSSATTSKKKPPRDPPLQPTLTKSSFDTDAAVPECLAGYTFVFSGVLPNLSREESQDTIKTLGGRVTGTVSSKTDYLVVGDILEDGREYTEGSKYKRAIKEGTIVVKGEEALYGLLQQYDDKARSLLKTAPPASKPPPPTASAAKAQPAATVASMPAPSANPYARTTAVTSNPYARKKAQVSAAAPPPVEDDVKMPAAAVKSGDQEEPNQLWVDKYKPKSSKEILGNDSAVRQLTKWLGRWEDRFNTPQAIGKTFSSPQGPWKAALLSGPPGIGKTTTATLVAKESGRDVIEFNASDVRSKKALKEQLGDIIGSRTIEFKKVGSSGKTPARKKRCIIMDEVDGMGAGDRSGISELIQMIKHSRVPIICICNDRQAQKLKSLIPYCMDLKYRRPVKSVIATRAIAIAAQEGLTVERNAAEAIVESCGNDVRQVLNCMHMWASDNRNESRMTYKNVKERQYAINKDEILRVSLFEAAKTIIQGRVGLSNADPQAERDHFFKRNDAFFVDYSFVGLIVQQNYLKIIQPQFLEAKRTNDQAKSLSVLERMHSAAESMSDFAHAENALRGSQNWSLLPFNAALAVKTGFHAGGDNGAMLSGFPEFTTWLGRNSTKGKKARLLNELQHHLNYKISGGTQEMRMAYLPVFRDRFLSLLSEEDGTEQAIQLMDEYGLDRDDIFENLDEFKMDPKAPTFAKIDSKKKAAFTRSYNAGAHKSQALVAEQGGGKKVKRKASSVAETPDLDAIDDDKAQKEEDEEEEDDELDEEKIKKMFKKKRKGGGGKAKGKGTSKAKGKKKK